MGWSYPSVVPEGGVTPAERYSVGRSDSTRLVFGIVSSGTASLLDLGSPPSNPSDRRVVPTDEFYPHIEEAEAAIGETDPDDVLYVACALANDADIWSDDADFDEQDVVEIHSTADVLIMIIVVIYRSIGHPVDRSSGYGLE